MLVELAIRDIVLIDKLHLAFGAGLSVLTGETGAGKSILLDAFSLALGARGDGSLVRRGQEQGQVTAVFRLEGAHPVHAVLDELGLSAEGDLILRRVQMADGRTRALVNDQAVSVQSLRAIGAALVEIHGQHDDRALGDMASHRAILDLFSGASDAVTAVSSTYSALHAVRGRLSEQRERLEAARKEADFLRHAVAELSALYPEIGEEETLAERRQAMMQSEKVASELAEAVDALSGPASPIPTLASIQRRLERRRDQAEALLSPGVLAIEAALNALEEARTVLEAAQRAADFDPRELERIEERLFAIRAAARKYHVTADGLAALAETFAATLDALDQGEGHLRALEGELEAADRAYRAAATALSALRQNAACELEAAVMSELLPLRLERARFIVSIERDETLCSPTGFDRVEFWVETNPGSRPGPMMKVASGGELSRFMLALKVSLAERGSAPTLVFDEIDTGVGGAVADAIGQRLGRLARTVQVLSVTHAPQVAARATTHFLIEKSETGTGNALATRVTEIAGEERREEVARMLSGAEITEEARAAASRLIAGTS